MHEQIGQSDVPLEVGSPAGLMEVRKQREGVMKGFRALLLLAVAAWVMGCSGGQLSLREGIPRSGIGRTSFLRE